MDATLPLAKQDFSLVLGGPIYQLFRRAHLSGPALEQLWRRIWFITLLAWVPLFVLTAMNGQAVGPPSALPFLRDIEAAMRLRNSVAIEVGLLVLAVTVGHWLWRSTIAHGSSSWYAVQGADEMR